MRDPKRIKPILNQLAALWTSSPDLRLGQLILNAAKLSNETEQLIDRVISEMGDEHWGEVKAEQFSDIYNVEDEELIRRICQYMKVGR